MGVSDTDTFGMGVRTLVDGAWGFAATSQLTRDSVASIARAALDQAKANRASQLRPVVLAPTPGNQVGEWKSPIVTDPFTVSMPDKVAVLLAATEAALKVKGIRTASASMFFLREEKTLMTSDGSYIVQTIYRTSPSMSVTAVSSDFSDFQSVDSNDIAPKGLGYEHVLNSKLAERAPQYAEWAVQKLVPSRWSRGATTCCCIRRNLWLTIHEVDRAPHRTRSRARLRSQLRRHELRRAAGAGAGQAQVRHPLMNIVGDRDAAGFAGRHRLGRRSGEAREVRHRRRTASSWTTRRRASRRRCIARLLQAVGKPVRSYGCSYAQSWADVQFQRMPNVSCMPGKNDDTWESMIAAMDRGIAIVGDGSFSIDQQRYNGQFAGQVFHEIKGGKIVGMLKDVAYQFRTPDFWGSLKAIGGPQQLRAGRRVRRCARGSPASPTPSATAACRRCFQQVNIINTGRRA